MATDKPRYPRTSVTRQSNLYKHTRKVVPIYSGNTFPKRENAIKILLDELNISQRQFAMKINLDAGYFSKIMRGKVNPPDRILLLIENVFNVNKDWLENGQGEIFSNQGISLAKKQVLESIDSLSDEQVNAVSSFIKYLTENKN